MSYQEELDALLRMLYDVEDVDANLQSLLKTLDEECTGRVSLGE